MTAPSSSDTTPLRLALPKVGTVTGWLLVAAALCVNVAVHRGDPTAPWVWVLAATVVICAGVERRRRRAPR